MAVKHKRAPRRKPRPAGYFDTNLRRGRPKGVSRGTARVSSRTTGSVNKRRYKLNPRGRQPQHVGRK